ncbi:MAG: MFS transporter [Propionibacteriaceae bacterium]|nr:MFS transporter [Propionibacteriaceae bacterium]
MPAPSTRSINWPRFIISAYGPTFLSTIGYGAVIPLVGLTALDLGASLAVSALITSLIGLGHLVADLPASWITIKLGEKKAIAFACLWDAVWLIVAFQADDLLVLALAVFAFGLSGAVFGLARQVYLTEAIELRYRARALSSLGGTFRTGFFIGPIVGAAIIAHWNLSAAYLFAGIMCLLAAGVTLGLPSLPGEVRTRRRTLTQQPKLFSVLVAHVHTYATLGVGALTIQLVRAVRQTVLPLWCASLGLDPSHTSLIYGLSMGIDVSLFFIGGWIMDRFGRLWVAMPSMVILGIGLVGLAWAHTPVAVMVIAVVLGLGNGIGAGIMMILGSDSSPQDGRTQFLSGWRLVGDTGHSVGPLLLAGITALTSLSVATVSLGLLAWGGAGWLAYWIRRSPLGKIHHLVDVNEIAE